VWLSLVFSAIFKVRSAMRITTLSPLAVAQPSWTTPGGVTDSSPWRVCVGLFQLQVATGAGLTVSGLVQGFVHGHNHQRLELVVSASKLNSGEQTEGHIWCDDGFFGVGW
jgi:hypothetical protein